MDDLPLKITRCPRPACYVTFSFVGGFVFLALSVGFAFGAEVYWTNVAGGDWSMAANWSSGSVPGTNDTVFVVSNGTYTVSLDVDPSIRDIG